MLANFFVILAGLLLGPLWGGGAVALYLSLGALGFPVFAGGGGGLASFAGPHGGYLAGYLVGAVIAGLFARRRGIIFSTLGSFLGFSSILALGAAGLSLLSGLSLSKASVLGILPFLLGDGIKAIAATIVAAKLGPFTDSLIGKPKPNV